MIGIILLIGIVKKNAIMMIDFALAAERNEGKNSRDAIFEACLLRFRPILMTTMAAMLGALPLALGTGTGSELRRPLGITIIGGLIVSQLLTLYTTPVVYLYFDRLQHWWDPGGSAALRGADPTGRFRRDARADGARHRRARRQAARGRHRRGRDPGGATTAGAHRAAVHAARAAPRHRFQRAAGRRRQRTDRHRRGGLLSRAHAGRHGRLRRLRASPPG
jgi:hypothetical protein